MKITPKTKTGRLAEEIERARTCDEALDTIVAALSMLNGEIPTPAPLGHAHIRRDLRDALLALHISLGFSIRAPNLRDSLRRCKRLDEALAGPLPSLDESIATVRELIADKDRRLGEPEGDWDALTKTLNAEIKVRDEATPALDAVDADFEEMEKRRVGGGGGAIAYVLVGLFAVLVGYAVGVLFGS